jgi:hypothetical protein
MFPEAIQINPLTDITRDTEGYLFYTKWPYRLRVATLCAAGISPLEVEKRIEHQIKRMEPQGFSKIFILGNLTVRRIGSNFQGKLRVAILKNTQHFFENNLNPVLLNELLFYNKYSRRIADRVYYFKRGQWEVTGRLPLPSIGFKLIAVH